jgi:cell division transport system permease protein
MNLNHFIQRAVADFRQNLPMQLMTTVVVCLSILIFTFFSFIYYNLQRTVERFGSELGLVVFLKTDIQESKIPILHQKLLNLPGIENVKYVSSEEAFERLGTYFEDAKGLLEGVDQHFLPASFELRINRAIFNLERIHALAVELEKWNEVAQVQYGKSWVDRLSAFVAVGEKVIWVSAVLLLATAAFVVSNTIKLAIYARQEEVSNMTLLGATNGIIQGPILLEALFQGLVGSLLSIGLVFCAIHILRALWPRPN